MVELLDKSFWSTRDENHSENQKKENSIFYLLIGIKLEVTDWGVTSPFEKALSSF